MGGRGWKLFTLAAFAGICITGAWLDSHRDRTGINHIPKSDAYCDVEVLAKPVIGTTRFEIVDIACDTLAKDETVRIYQLTTHKSWFGRLEDGETLVFAYDPAEQDVLPRMAIDSASKLTISIPWISSIWYKADRWNGRPINYEIGRIEYP